MKIFRKIVYLIAILLLPVNIFAVGITIEGDGNSPGGGSTSGGSVGGKVGIYQSVGFRAAIYEYNPSSPDQSKIIKTRYYLRARYLSNSNFDQNRHLKSPGIFEYTRPNFVSMCGKANFNSYSPGYRYISTNNGYSTTDNSSSQIVGFLEPTNCNVGEVKSGTNIGAWGTERSINVTNCVFSAGPGWTTDMGITLQARNLVSYLQSMDGNESGNLLYNMITYLYGKAANTLSASDVANQYILIEPLLHFRYNNTTDMIATANDAYIYSIKNGAYNYEDAVKYDPGNPSYFASSMFTIYTNYVEDWVISPGRNHIGNRTTVGDATCWRNGLGAIYINMAEGMTCAPDQCCFDKVSDNTYKYDSTYATSGDDHQWNKYKLKNPNNSTFVTTVNSQKQIKDTYLDNHQFSEPDSTFEKCGCDQTDPDMCCYAYDGTTYTYKPELNASTTDKYNYYQFIDAATGKPAPNDTRPGEFKSCGCDPETQCCYDSTGTYQASYQGTGYGVSGRYSKDGGVLMPCFCASSSSSNGSCGGKATKKQVNADNDELACLANFDSSGTSRSNVNGAYYNNEVGCEFEYEVSYPEPSPRPTAESGKKLQLVTGPLVTVKVTRKCVSTNKSKLEALTAKPTIVLSSKKFKYDDQSMLGLTSAQTFDLYTRDDKTESGKSFKYQSENVGTTINEGDYFLREYTYTYNYYIPYLEYNSTEGVVKILSTEPPEENNEFWINKLPIPYNAESKTGKDYTRYISMNITQNGSNKLSYSDGGITCNYNVTDANKVKFFYRVIDLDNMNKLSRNLGYNWSDSRGQTVKTAVEQTGNYTALTSKDKFSFTLDPATMVMIRNYNKKESQGNHGGYNDGNRLTETKEGVNGCHYHWYSPFLYCLYYGNDGTNCNISTSVDVSGCLVKFKSNDNLENTFDHYTSISKPNSGGFDQYDFETNMGNLIKKQYNLG